METQIQTQRPMFRTSKKTKTNLTVELVRITPKIAKNYLRYNPKNRLISENHLTFLTNEMKQDRWKENGESICFDINGNLNNGQHRLTSIIRSGKSYNIPIVRGVDPMCMATYDTGKNRTAADVLLMNGFKNGMKISTIIKSIHKYNIINSKQADDSSSRKSTLSNQQVLEYCSNNYDWILPMFNKVVSIYNAETTKVLSLSFMAVILYRIGGETPQKTHYEFVKLISGVNRQIGTAPNYLYVKLYNSKINKEPLNRYWILGMAVKSWNYYFNGNPSIKFFKFDIKTKIQKVKNT